MLVENSLDFIEMVRESVPAGADREVRDAIALWCANQPRWYQDFVWSTLDIPYQQIQPEDRVRVRAQVERLAAELRRKRAVCVFLLEDGRSLAEHYRDLGGKPEFVTYGRRSLPDPQLNTYFKLFGMVNRAARQAGGDWDAFRNAYEAEFAALLDSELGELIERSIESCMKSVLAGFRRSVSSGERLVLVDTGMQGTFILALAAWLRRVTKADPGQIDVFLLSAYPWLADLYKDRCICTNASIIASVERLRRMAA